LTQPDHFARVADIIFRQVRGRTSIQRVKRFPDGIRNRAGANDSRHKLKARLADVGGDALALSPADFEKLIADETEKWGKVIRAANIKPEWSARLHIWCGPQFIVSADVFFEIQKSGTRLTVYALIRRRGTGGGAVALATITLAAAIGFNILALAMQFER
jgi:hypothetical protein